MHVPHRTRSRAEPAGHAGLRRGGGSRAGAAAASQALAGNGAPAGSAAGAGAVLPAISRAVAAAR
ncbi:hypothetical protein FYK34_05630 [Chromobacterium paludis]|uniref:Uncharacterized protein n=1 Tax=Chromobacterium paludis TaxID=2605945 RepID=A0A5C1DEZ3_9NEIS|nr:hypothetical protein FYK34_05630 [Chromobacterium paludis]